MTTLQTVLSQMLATPPRDASKDMLEAYLKLLSEAYQSTCTLARNLQVRTGFEGEHHLSIKQKGRTSILIDETVDGRENSN